LIEATTKPAVFHLLLSLSQVHQSIHGTLETICCDLLFLEPVAMSAFPLIGGIQYMQK
jgi:hypothetical protein